MKTGRVVEIGLLRIYRVIPKIIPKIILQGVWLEQPGFETGEEIKVVCEQ